MVAPSQVHNYEKRFHTVWTGRPPAPVFDFRSITLTTSPAFIAYLRRWLRRPPLSSAFNLTFEPAFAAGLTADAISIVAGLCFWLSLALDAGLASICRALPRYMWSIGGLAV